MIRWKQELLSPASEYGVPTERSMQENYVRNMLKADARNRFPEIIATMGTSYSITLQRYQDKLNTYQKNKHDANNITVLDLDKFIVGLSYGLSEGRILYALHHNEKINPKRLDKQFSKSESLAKRSLTSPVNYKQHNKGVFFHPGHHHFVVRSPALSPAPDREIDFIVPALDYMPSYIPGLTAQEQVEFINAHEIFYFLDPACAADRFQSQGGPCRPNARQLVHNTGSRDEVLQLHHREAFATIAACGTLIRQGANPDIIDHIATYVTVGDFVHHVANELHGFKDDLAGLGLNKFLGLGNEDAIDFYAQSVKRHGVTSKQLHMAAQLEDADKDHLPDANDPDYTRAQELAELLHRTKPQEHDVSTNGASSKDSFLPEKRLALAEFDARKELIDRAFNTSRQVTPETMSKAFLSLLEERRAQRRTGYKDDDMLIAEMIKLQVVFLDNAINYVEENEKRGNELKVAKNGLPVFVPVRNQPQPK